MTYPNTVISMPSQLFTMRSSFKAVANGNVYIGEVDTDPTIPANQIQVYIEQENGTLVPVAQPIKINSAGFLTASGQVQKFVLTNTEYSMAVLNAYGVQEHYFPRVYDQGISAALEVEERLLGPGAKIYRGSNGQYIQNGDVIPSENPPYTHLAVPINGKAEDVAMSPIASGIVSLLTEIGATIGGNSVLFNYSRSKQFTSLSSAINSPYISNLDVVNVKDRIDGGGGGGTWDVVLTSSVTPDGYGVVQSVEIPSLSFVLRTEQTLFSKQFGASPDNTTAQNKAIIQHMINLLDGIAGCIEVEADIDYGFTKDDESTWPDFSTLSNDPNTRITINDRSMGKNTASEVLPNRSGNQLRVWPYTGNEQDGVHNGNFMYWNSKWHGGVYLNHNGGDEMLVANGGAGKNRRASFITGVKDVAFWRFGQGGFTDDTKTDDELANFLIAVNNIPDLGISGLSAVMSINKTDACVGWNKSLPVYPFDFNSRVGQPSSDVMSFTSVDKDPQLLLQGPNGIARLQARGDGGVGVVAGTSSVYKSTGTGSVHTFTRSNAGSLSLKLATPSFDRNIKIEDNNGTINITNDGAISNVFSLDTSGNLTISGAYSPFTGTHVFFCKDKIDEGYAVELVDHSIVDFVHYVDSIDEYEDVIVEVEEVRPPRLKGEMDESYNDRCTPAYSYIKKVLVDKDPIERVMSLNGTVALCDTPESKICAGIVEHQVEMEGGYLTFVAAVGDNKTENLKGFRVNGDIEAGDILCTDMGGKLKISPENISRSVVTFKAMSPVDSDGRCYGYFLG